MPTPSRGDAVSGYLPPFAAGAKVYNTNLRSQALTGAVISAGVVRAISHTLGAVPTVIVVTPRFAAADVAAATTGIAVSESAASAATSAVFYVVANKNAVKFRAFLML